MGFDLYGMNPIMNKPKPDMLIKHKWNEVPEEKQKEYWDAEDEDRLNNPGQYFRANNWCWRPIWTFVVGACDFLTDTDIEKGEFNDGAIISKTKAKRIASKIRNLDKIGVILAYEENIKLVMARAKKKNDKLRAKQKELAKRVEKKFGDGYVPADYPEPWKSEWKKYQKAMDWSEHYPFKRDWIVDFATLCEQSGGFQIC